MASDPHFYGAGGNRVAFHTIKESADATGNGVEVQAAAATGKSHYITGVILHNRDAASLTLTLVHTAGAAGKTAIGIVIALAANTGIAVLNFDAPLHVGSAKNFGILASAAGNVSCEAWGYTTNG